MVRFAIHPQSGGLPVVQVWREDNLGSGAWEWVRTPGDFAALTNEQIASIKELAQ